MKKTSKEYRKKNHFLLYDCEENVIYIDSPEELKKFINTKFSDIVRQFNKFGEIIDVVIDGHYYQLYTFEDNDEEEENFI